MGHSRESVSDLAYDLWLRRGGGHGGDVDDWLEAGEELRFFRDYETLAEVDLDRAGDDASGRRCRLCERTVPRTAPSARPSVWPGRDLMGLRTGEICADCQAASRAPLAGAFDEFWGSLTAERGPIVAEVATLKALATSLILVAPEDELEYLGDAIEWLANPDLDADAALFDGVWCRVYWGDPGRGRAWAALSRRRDDDVNGPYLVGWVGRDGVVVETSIPLCVRDQDRDGLALPPRRSFVLGGFAGTGRTRSVVLPLGTDQRAAVPRYG